MEESALVALSELSKIVVDSANFEDYAGLNPTDATTNPSLILGAIDMPTMSEAVQEALAKESEDEMLNWILFSFACQILNRIPGRVSVEIDARDSRNTENTVRKALLLIKTFRDYGYDTSRILVKIASTWEGIEAARILEKEHNIHCNLTLMFCIPQAAACANAGVTLISPFVGRILDWHLNVEGSGPFEPKDEPGVKFVRDLYGYFKKFSIKTEIMAASFRNVGEILNLGGLDCVTVSPALLRTLAELPPSAVVNVLTPQEAARACRVEEPIKFPDQTHYEQLMLKHASAHQLLNEGIAKFEQDTIKLVNKLNALKSNK